MTRKKTVRELIAETNRDVKWICEVLKRMERRDEDFEGRLQALEAFRHTNMRRGRRVSKISSGAGGIVGGIEAVRCGCFAEGSRVIPGITSFRRNHPAAAIAHRFPC